MLTQSPKQFWQQIANSDNSESPNQKDLVQAQLERESVLHQLWCIGKKDRVLELGCGPGTLLKKVGKLDGIKEVVGVDFIPKFIEQAKQTMPTGQFHIANILCLPFPDNTFDVVVSCRCLINLKSDQQQQSAINQVWRVLKPYGKYILIEASKQGYQRLNHVRKMAKLSPVQISKHNHPIDLDKLNLSNWIIKPQESFNTYYYKTRILYPSITNDVRYNTMMHHEIANQQRQFGDLGVNCSPIINWQLMKVTK